MSISIFSYPCRDCLDFFPNGDQIIKGFRTLANIPQKRGGMINGSHPDAVSFHPLAVLPGDAVIGIDQFFGCDPAETYDDFRFEQSNLIAKIADAGILFGFQCLQKVFHVASNGIRVYVLFLS